MENNNFLKDEFEDYTDNEWANENEISFKSRIAYLVKDYAEKCFGYNLKTNRDNLPLAVPYFLNIFGLIKGEIL